MTGSASLWEMDPNYSLNRHDEEDMPHLVELVECADYADLGVQDVELYVHTATSDEFPIKLVFTLAGTETELGVGGLSIKDLVNSNLRGEKQAADIIATARARIKETVALHHQQSPLTLEQRITLATAATKKLPGDDEQVTLTWVTTEVLEHEHTFTWGELRELLGVGSGEDIEDEWYRLGDLLADYDNSDADLHIFERNEIAIKEGT